MNEVEWLRSLDRPTRVPAVDVTKGVMRAVETMQREDDDSVFPIGAGLAVIAGGAALAAAIPAWIAAQNPLVAMLDQFQLVLK